MPARSQSRPRQQASQPSTEMSVPWLQAYNPSVHCFYSDDKTGKWCIVRPSETIDAAWEAIKELISQSKLLGGKVSTLGLRMHTFHDTHVICLYTRDWSDEADVMATRETLREAGFTEMLNYKRDLETIRPNPDFEFYYSS